MGNEIDICKYLEIKNIFFSTPGGITNILKLQRIEEEKITVTSTNLQSSIGILNIETHKERINVVVTAVKDFSENNTYTLFLEDPLPDDFKLKIAKINELKKGIEKRKEERFDIGLSGWKEFGLIKPDCYFLKDKNITKVIIKNASIHGALLTGERSPASIGDKLIFVCNFKDGIIKHNCVLLKEELAKQSYFNYAVRFLEPISILWSQHIINYDKK